MKNKDDIFLLKLPWFVRFLDFSTTHCDDSRTDRLKYPFSKYINAGTLFTEEHQNSENE